MTHIRCKGCGWMIETTRPPIPRTEEEWDAFDEWVNNFLCEACQRREERIEAGVADESDGVF